MSICAGWLIGHTLTEDQAITGDGISTWDHLLPEEERKAMRKVIVQLVFDMFHLESQMISDSYGGEKFGDGIYYRLVYGTPADDKRQEILMVFEEKLLLNTVGKIMGLQTNKLDSRRGRGPGRPRLVRRLTVLYFPFGWPTFPLLRGGSPGPQGRRRSRLAPPP